MLAEAMREAQAQADELGRLCLKLNLTKEDLINARSWREQLRRTKGELWSAKAALYDVVRSADKVLISDHSAEHLSGLTFSVNKAKELL